MKSRQFRSALNPAKTPYHLTSLAGALLISCGASPLHATTYMLNMGQSSPSAGIVVWDVTDGAYAGTLTLTSTNVPNVSINFQSFTNFTFLYDINIASEFEIVYLASAADSSSGEESKADEISLYVGDTAGSEFYFETNNTIFESGSAGYGSNTAMSGNPLVPGDSGSGEANAFLTSSGAQFKVPTVEGEGNAVGWSMSFTNSPSTPSDPSDPSPNLNLSTISGSLNLEAIPEPSSALLLALSSMSLLVRRKRNCPSRR
ncbi:MAG: PEP-CTERM sorting domain-containing protein [Roseibacillus sp.]